MCKMLLCHLIVLTTHYHIMVFFCSSQLLISGPNPDVMLHKCMALLCSHCANLEAWGWRSFSVFHHLLIKTDEKLQPSE